MEFAHGTIDLEDKMGSDLRVVHAAQVSLHRRVEEFTDRERGIINFMLREHHGTPLEHVVFTFRVRVPVKVGREWFRHRTDSYNEESTRYVKMRDDFYVPTAAAVRAQVGTPGRYSFNGVTPELAVKTQDRFRRVAEFCYNEYQEAMADGVARELASFLLPLHTMTEFFWTVKLRNLFHFMSLRTANQALLEIREVALALESQIAAIVPVSYGAWNEFGRPLIGDSDWDGNL